MRSLLVLTGAVVWLLVAGAPPAAAAPCPISPALTVAGTEPGTQGVPLQVTGSDCVTNGDGSVTIQNPRIGGFGGVGGDVTLDTTMVLSSDRSRMTRQVLTSPAVMRVDGDVVITGPIEIRDVQFCDLAPPGSGPPFQLAPPAPPPAPQEGEIGVNHALPTPVNCRLVPGMVVTSPTPGAVVTLLGLAAAVRPGQVTFLIDNERGGRIAGVLPFRIPVPGASVTASVRPALGLQFEVSKTLGTQLIGVAGDYARGFAIPGTDVAVRQLGLTIVPAESRFGGPAAVTLGGFRARGQFEVTNQQISRLSASAILSPTGVAVFPPNFFISNLDVGFQPGGTFQLATGGTISLPSTLAGKATWALRDPRGGSRLGGEMNATFGNAARFSGSYCLTTPRDPCTARLAQAGVTVQASPFRLESQSAINVLSGRFVGNVSGGASLDPFNVTYLGNLTVKVPTGVPLVGGQTVSGASSAVSQKGAGALVRVPNPFGEDPTVGFATLFTSPFQTTSLSSLSSVVTFASSRARSSQSGQRTLRLRRSLGQALVEVVGTRRAPRGVRLRSSGGRLRIAPVPGRSRRTAAFVVSRLPAGSLRASSRHAIASMRVSRIGTFPYLEPAPGYGTRSRPPVVAGTPVRVCWNVRHAGRGLQVDLLEDQNGRVAVGRTIAEDRRAKGCFSIPTAGFEPGRHWVYGVVHNRRDAPISARYWPIGIDVVDPAALPAPTGLAATPTADGANVTFDDVAGANLYVIRAEPTEQGAARPVLVQAASGAENGISLRGAASWNVSVQAADADGKVGNVAGPVVVTPSAGVVVSGTPNGLAEVGKPWAFRLETANVARLRLVSGPRGARLSANGLVRWTPRPAAVRKGFVTFSVEGCSDDARCATREFSVTPFASGRVPFGPIRGFQVLQSVVRPRQLITLIAQGVRGRVRVTVDGRRVRARVLDSGSVRAKLPARLARGAHDVSLRIGGNLEEVARSAIVVR